MRNLLISWILPTTRAPSGAALPVEEIASVLIEISADGITFAPVGSYPPSVLSAVVEGLDVGTWYVRGVAYDTLGQRGVGAIATVTVEPPVVVTPDPPGLLAITLTLS
jgi:hypothetical protein